MSFNYAREKRKFEKEWEVLYQKYSRTGMPEDAIAQMKEYDWVCFCGNRIYQMHTQAIPQEVFDADEEHSTLLKKFPNLSVQLELGSGRYGWIESIEDDVLYGRLQALAPKDLELVTLLVIEKYTRAGIAKLWGCSRSAITQRVNKIAAFLYAR